MDYGNTVKYELFSHDKISIQDCLSFCESITGDYIWHKECFNLTFIEHSSGLTCLSGSTDVGDNIIDEWVIVFLLVELTRQYSDVIAHVSDDDGEFLLIQAADELPSWLNPECSENRIFIHQGYLHIIPQYSDGYPTPSLSIAEAYKIVVSTSNTTASDRIQELIRQKFIGYPQKIKDHLHHAHCFLPSEIIYILKRKPQYISNAVQALYDQNDNDFNSCQNLKTFVPENRAMALIKFSKYLYGQLHHANIHPSSKSNWKLPKPSEPFYKPYSLGYKLTCGFEILLNNYIDEGKQLKKSEPAGRSWEQYISNLNKYDFFQGEQKGSKKYTELLDQAKEKFTKVYSSSRDYKTEKDIESIYYKASKNLGGEESCQDLSPEDSDDWLTISLEEMDQMMKKTTANSSQSKGDDFLNMTTQVKGFVDHVSSYEGAEVVSSNVDNEEKISFQQEKFMACLNKLIDPSKSSHCRNLSAKSDDDEDSDDNDDDFLSCFKEEEHSNSEVSSLFERFDSELKNSTMQNSFCDDESAPLQIDMNVIQNFLESFTSQCDVSGPVSSILQSLPSNHSGLL